jgi:hypothetical protein
MVELKTGVSTYTTKSSTGYIHVHVNAKDEKAPTLVTKIVHLLCRK